MKKKLFFIFVLSFIFLFLFLLNGGAFANVFDDIISKSDLKSPVGVYFFDNSDKKIIYKKNENTLFNPASTLKVLTFGASYLVLGDDYEFKTALYKDNQNNIYLKLGADALLKQSDLDELISKISNTNFKNLYIDPYIIDSDELYPASWLEEDVWPYQRGISPYIIDSNYATIALRRSSLAQRVDVIQNGTYKMAIINELKIGDNQDYKIETSPKSPSIVVLKGTINKDEIINLPVLNPEINFNVKLRASLEKNKIVYLNQIKIKKTPSDAKYIASVSHNIKEISREILYNSNNFIAEVVFKVAGAKYIDYQRSAALDDAIAMFRAIFRKYLNENTVIADASGVSRQNLITLESYMGIFNELLISSDLKTLLMSANEGTLTDRMLYLQNNLKAKTGTLKNYSSLAGVLNSKQNKEIYFGIITQNSPKRKALLKYFEENMISELYKNY